MWTISNPIALNQPPAGTVIENLLILYKPGAGDYGISVNGSKGGLVIRNCIVSGFKFNISLSGGNVGANIYDNWILNSTSGGQADTSGLYTEGLQNYYIGNNVIANNGWWVGFDPNNPADVAAANRHHGWYGNESYGSGDSGTFVNNLVIDNLGSGVGCRKGGTFIGNVFRGTTDYDLIGASLGGNIDIHGNAFFGPKISAPGFWGGGIHAIGTGPVFDNWFSGSAASTVNPCALNSDGSRVIPCRGVWPKPGAKQVVPGTPVLTLESYFATMDVLAKLTPGLTTDIINWVRAGSQ